MNRATAAGITIAIALLIVWGYHQVTHPAIEVNDSSSTSIPGTANQANEANTQTQSNTGTRIFSDDDSDNEEEED